MKILHNPATGSAIHDVWIKNVLWFNSKKDEYFSPGDVFQFEDEIADRMLELFDFLKDVDQSMAKQLADKKNHKFKCEEVGCDFTTNTPVALQGHKRSHDAKRVSADSGIPVAQGYKRDENGEMGAPDIQHDIESDGFENGLTGKGIEKDFVNPDAHKFA